MVSTNIESAADKMELRIPHIPISYRLIQATMYIAR
jgi:hypothetical protein